MAKFRDNLALINAYAHPIIVRLVQASEFQYEPGEVVPSHKHQISEIRFIIKGKVKTYVGKKRYLTSDNSFYFIRAGDTHYQYTVTETRMYHLAFFITNMKSIGISRYNKNDSIEKKDIDLIKGIMKYPSVVFDAPADIVDSLNEIYGNFHRGNADYGKISKLFEIFLIRLSKILKNQTCYRDSARINLNKFNYKIRRAFNKLKRQLMINCNKRVDLSRMAGELNLSNRHFERIFRQISGCTPTEYLMRIRIRKALKLLKSPKSKIENIIRALGFNNNSRFYKYFKKYIGISPGDYKSYSTENKGIITDLFKQE